MVFFTENNHNHHQTSCDQLFKQIYTLAKTYSGFPKIYDHYLIVDSDTPDTHTNPPKPIEILLLLNGAHTQASTSPANMGTDWLKITSPSAPLSLFPDQHGYVNSARILDSIHNYLQSVKEPWQMEIEPQVSALILKLKDYEWAFKLTLAIPVNNKAGERIYYLIADGRGNWLRLESP